MPEAVNRPDYRGVDQNSIINSLKRAEDFVRGLHLGPEHDKALKEWLAHDPYTKIAAAQDRNELAQVMGETGSAGIFYDMREILLLHAVGNETSKKLLEDLGRWGAFDGARLTNYTPLDEEQDRYLIKEYGRHALAQGNIGQSRIDQYFDLLRQYQPGQVEDMEQGYNDLLVMMSYGDAHDFCDELELAFEMGDLRDRHVMKMILFVMSGLPEEQEKIEVPSAMKRYGVVVDNLPKNFGEMEQAIGTLLDDVSRELSQFWATDEVQMIGMGPITRDMQQMGVVFQSSEAAARVIAKAFPRHRVIDETGRTVENPENPQPEIPAPVPPAP